MKINESIKNNISLEKGNPQLLNTLKPSKKRIVHSFIQKKLKDFDE